MRRVALKTAKRKREAAPFREQIVWTIGRCEWCGRHNNGLCVHEILRGGYRQQAQDKPYATLVLCDDCHREMGGRPLAEQLAILRRSRPEDYSLPSFWKLGTRNYPDQSEVSLWSMRLSFVSP